MRRSVAAGLNAVLFRNRIMGSLVRPGYCQYRRLSCGYTIEREVKTNLREEAIHCGWAL